MVLKPWGFLHSDKLYIQPEKPNVQQDPNPPSAYVPTYVPLYDETSYFGRLPNIQPTVHQRHQTCVPVSFLSKTHFIISICVTFDHDVSVTAKNGNNAGERPRDPYTVAYTLEDCSRNGTYIRRWGDRADVRIFEETVPINNGDKILLKFGNQVHMEYTFNVLEDNLRDNLRGIFPIGNSVGGNVGNGSSSNNGVSIGSSSSVGGTGNIIGSSSTSNGDIVNGSSSSSSSSSINKQLDMVSSPASATTNDSKPGSQNDNSDVLQAQINQLHAEMSKQERRIAEGVAKVEIISKELYNINKDYEAATMQLQEKNETIASLQVSLQESAEAMNAKDIESTAQLNSQSVLLEDLRHKSSLVNEELLHKDEQIALQDSLLSEASSVAVKEKNSRIAAEKQVQQLRMTNSALQDLIDESDRREQSMLPSMLKLKAFNSSFQDFMKQYMNVFAGFTDANADMDCIINTMTDGKCSGVLSSYSQPVVATGTTVVDVATTTITTTTTTAASVNNTNCNDGSSTDTGDEVRCHDDDDDSLNYRGNVRTSMEINNYKESPDHDIELLPPGDENTDSNRKRFNPSQDDDDVSSQGYQKKQHLIYNTTDVYDNSNIYMHTD